VRDDRQRLVDILDAIDRVYRHTRSGREAFERDELVQVWVLRHLQLIAEAARHLPQEIRTQYPEIPWAAIVAIRNSLVHDYFAVSLEIVWQVVERDLPALRSQVETVLRAQGWRRPPSMSERSRPYSAAREFAGAADRVLACFRWRDGDALDVEIVDYH
jgi:uncharacterized protein with HEPN domain